ncbi:MAG: tetratricopeptide repeat protein [Lachnospiraceae bacterium]
MKMLCFWLDICLIGEGVTPDSVVAGEWFERGAEAGDPSAMFNLGELYFNGDGVEQDYDIAEQWFRRAAELGNESAQYYLDEYYD